MIPKTYYLPFIPRIFFKRGMPLQLIFFVTSQCNLRCQHCFYWKELNKNKNQELTTDEIHKFSQNSKLNLLWLTLTGGEPFLRPDLFEIAKFFYQNGKIINLTIPTNGQLPEAIFDTTKKILKFCVQGYVLVSISLDGTEKINDQIRGKGAFKKAIETLQRLKKLKGFPNFGLSIQTTLTSLNQDKIRDLYLFLRDELKPDYFNFNLIRGNPFDLSLKSVDIRYYKEISKLLEEDIAGGKWPNFNFPLHKVVLLKNFSVYRDIAETYKANKYQNPCWALTLSGVISEKGDLYPCELLENSKIGNLRDVNYDISRLWFSKESNQIRERISDKCFCTYECALSTNTLFNAKFYLKNLKKLIF